MSKQVVEEDISRCKTLRSVLQWSFQQLAARDLYYGHGTDNAWDEAVYLSSFTGSLSAYRYPKNVDGYLTRLERTEIIERVKKRINQRIPAAYLTQQAWFSGLSFYIDSRVLIPRSPLAELIEQRFSPWIKPNKVFRILDLGTGSGCIAVACAYAFPQAQIDASDISSDALEVANMNIKQHQCEKQIYLHQSDLFQALAPKKYDIIISNPPYVESCALTTLPAEYHYEPSIGLEGGPQGLDKILVILKQAHCYLSEGGILVVEVGLTQRALMSRFPNLPFIWLEFTRGFSEVFLLTAADLLDYFS